MNSFDWLAQLDIADVDPFDFVEVSFKNGARKAFFRSQPFYRPVSGDMVVVDVGGGFDIGRVTLSGELVRLQMKKRRTNPDSILFEVIRKANERDLERLEEARDLERPTMIEARAIARSLGLDMKVGDVEYQGDKRKATFYYTANGRVDFRELIRQYAKEFRVKIEMRQIGARQESARIGGLGSCGRELCCSTWLTDFKSVSTGAARYQNLAINQSKLSGQCGRLKCCLNYELDTYIDALEDFPDRAERLKTAAGLAILIKTDVFKRLMYYTYAEDRGKLFAVHVDQIWEALAMIKSGKLPGSLEDILAMAPQVENDEPEEAEPDFENVHDVIQLPIEKRKKKKKKHKNNRDRSESAAAAVEKAALQDETPQGRRPQQPRRDDRNRRPDNRPAQQNRPNNEQRREQRPPQEQRPPREQRPPQGQGTDRPPQQQRPPQPPSADNPDQAGTPPQQGGGGNPRNRDKRRFKGKGPRKE